MPRRPFPTVLRLGIPMFIAVAIGGCTWLEGRFGAGSPAPGETSASSDRRGAGNAYRSLPRQRGDREGSAAAASIGGKLALDSATEAGEGDGAGGAVMANGGSPPAQAGSTAAQGPLNVTRPGQASGGLAAARPGAMGNAEPRAGDVDLAMSAPRGGRARERLSEAQVATRLEQARRLLQRGKVIEARATLSTVAEHTPAAALHELGRTYDPYYLGQLPSIDDGSEPRTAASLYQDAISHGAISAGNDLDRLRASHPGIR